MADELFRLRVSYRKGDRLAYLGHREVINTVERSVRRSGLPFSVGNGFARRMRVQFSQALPVGAFSDGEYYDVMLTEQVSNDKALAMLAKATPPALGPLTTAYVERRMPALEAWLNRALWRIDIDGERLDAAVLDHALATVAQRGSIDFMRGDKPRTIELATTLVSWEVQPRDGGLSVQLETRSLNVGALRPAVLLDAAFAEEELRDATRRSQRVCRMGQWHEEDGRLVKPFDKTFSWSLT